MCMYYDCYLFDGSLKYGKKLPLNELYPYNSLKIFLDSNKLVHLKILYFTGFSIFLQVFTVTLN